MKKPRPMPPWLGAMGVSAPVLRRRDVAAAIWAARARRALPWGRLVT